MTRYLIKSGHKEYFDSWDEHNIVSIGWPRAARRMREGASKDELYALIKDRYEDSGSATTSALKCFNGDEWKSRTPMAAGDTVVVIGQDNIKGRSAVRAIAKVGEVDFKSEGFEGSLSHKLYRPVREWLYNNGPVTKRSLPDRFQQGGDAATHLVPTLNEWQKADDEDVDALVEALARADPVQERSYSFDFDEATVQAHLKDHWEDLLAVENPEEYTADAEVLVADDRRADFVFKSDTETVVVETKVGLGEPTHIDQLQRYMDAISGENPVRGILLTEGYDQPERVSQAVGDYNIEVQTYDVTLAYGPNPN